MAGPVNLPSYIDLGFSNFLEKPMAETGFSVAAPTGGTTSYGGGQLNFDQVQTTGSLGDKIQVGNITIDGSSGRIVINDGQNDRLIIGELP